MTTTDDLEQRIRDAHAWATQQKLDYKRKAAAARPANRDGWSAMATAFGVVEMTLGRILELDPDD